MKKHPFLLGVLSTLLVSLTSASPIIDVSGCKAVFGDHANSEHYIAGYGLTSKGIFYGQLTSGAPEKNSNGIVVPLNAGKLHYYTDQWSELTLEGGGCGDMLYFWLGSIVMNWKGNPALKVLSGAMFNIPTARHCFPAVIGPNESTGDYIIVCVTPKLLSNTYDLYDYMAKTLARDSEVITKLCSYENLDETYREICVENLNDLAIKAKNARLYKAWEKAQFNPPLKISH